MTYKISFNAVSSADGVVGVATFTLTTDQPLDLEHKEPAFRRMCVEYARLIGIPCSFAEITDVDERK
jgi:hypothetical protein